MIGHGGGGIRPLTRTLVWVVVLSSSFCGGTRAQVAVPAPTPADRQALDLSSNPDAQADRLYSQIWMEASPEYRALCLQAFNAALLQVQTQARLAPEVGGKPVGAGGLPLAVVTDLDETILDNSGYQRQLVLAGKEFSPGSWNTWVRQLQGVRLTPGAKAFIDGVESLGVTMLYISNRPDQYRQSTIDTMRELGLNVEGLDDIDSARLQLRQSTSDKQPRRNRARQGYDIIAFLGDNIEDFPARLSARDPGRPERLQRFRELWGTRWFVIPNPIYGSWTRPLRNQPPREFLERLPR